MLRAYYEQAFEATKVTDELDIDRGVAAYKALPDDNPLAQRHRWFEPTSTEWFTVANFRAMNGSGFRTRHAFMKGSSGVYAMPRTIESRLDHLVTFTKQLMHPDPTHMVRVAAFFFTEFVKIHPFPKHNLHTARRITTRMLRDHVPIPFSMFATEGDLERFLRVPDASEIAGHIIKSIHISAAQAEWLMLCDN